MPKPRHSEYPRSCNIAHSLLIRSRCRLQTGKPPHLFLDRADLIPDVHFKKRVTGQAESNRHSPAIAALILQPDRDDRHAGDAIPLGECREADEPRLKRKERIIAGLRGKAGVDIRIALRKDQHQLSPAEQVHTLPRSR